MPKMRHVVQSKQACKQQGDLLQVNRDAGSDHEGQNGDPWSDHIK